MRRLDNYIIEKLHLVKGVKHCHGELKHFIVVYSSRGEDKFKFFGEYDDAVIFSKKEYYLAGWCLTQEQYEETWDVVCHMTDEPFNTIREDWLKRLVKYAKENNLVDLFKYEKITEKLHLTKANKVNLADVPSKNIAKAIENSVFMKFQNEVNEDISRELLRWVKENNVEKYHGYSNNRGYETISKFGSIKFDKNTVNIYIERLLKGSSFNRYSSKTVGIMCNEILRKSDTPTLYVALKNVDFVILKD